MTDKTIRLIAQAEWKVPKLPGVYLICDGNVPLYVGKTTDLRKRFLEHLNRSHNLELKDVINTKTLLFSFKLVFNEKDLALVEQKMIRTLKPQFNKVRYGQSF